MLACPFHNGHARQGSTPAAPAPPRASSSCLVRAADSSSVGAVFDSREAHQNLLYQMKPRRVSAGFFFMGKTCIARFCRAQALQTVIERGRMAAFTLDHCSRSVPGVVRYSGIDQDVPASLAGQASDRPAGLPQHCFDTATTWRHLRINSLVSILM